MEKSYFVLIMILSCKLALSQTFAQSSLFVTQGVQQPDNIMATISITANPNPFCPGANVNFTATATNIVTTPSYQWKVNGSNVGSNSPSYSYFPLPGDSDIVPNVGATNESGFTAIPGGNRDYSGNFFGYMGAYGYFWSSSFYSLTKAWPIYLHFNYTNVFRFSENKNYGYSCRCLKD